MSSMTTTKKLFGQGNKYSQIEKLSMGALVELKTADVAWLTRPFDMEEVKKAVFDMKEDTAPGRLAPMALQWLPTKDAGKPLKET